MSDATPGPKTKRRHERLQRMDPEILDVQGAAEILGLSVTSLYRFARAGKVPGVRIGKAWRFSRKTLIAWVQNGTQGSALEALFAKARPAPRPRG